jgi:hypothetical protein
MTRDRRQATVVREVSMTADPSPQNPPAPDAPEPADVGRRGVRVATDVPRQMIRVAYRDPEHISERLTLQAVHRLAEPSLQWAQAARAAHPDGDLGDVVSGLGTQTARIARLQGMVAGTPFYLALVPGYMNYLWQEARMNLRLAALYGRDPGILQTAAELLSLRGVYPTVKDAEAGLLAVEDAGIPPKPEHRRPLRLWIACGMRLLVFGGFIGPPTGESHSSLRARIRDVLGVLMFVALWAITWIFPVTFMIMMAWGCETHSRQLFQRTRAFYAAEPSPEERPPEPGRGWRARVPSGRQAVSAAGLALSIAIPAGFLAYAIHVHKKFGITWVTAIGLLVALSVVTAAAVYGSRR